MCYRILQPVFIIFLAILLCSCRKEVDNYGPEVIFSSPFENQTFQIYDHVAFSISVKDQTKITAVSITLVDVNYIPVQSGVNLVISSPQMSVSTSYQITNRHLESGRYYLMVSASDGKNDSRTFRSIMIIGIPKELKKVFLATASSSSQTNLLFIDSAFSGVTPYHTFTGDHTGIYAGSYDQQLLVCGNYTGAFSCIKLEDHSVKFTMPAIPGVTPYYTALYCEEKQYYFARYDETIKGYNNNGIGIFNAAANSGYYVRKMIMNSGCLIAEEKNKVSSGRILVSFFATGTAQQQVALNQDVADFCAKDDHNVFVFGNNSGQGVIQLYDRLNNNLWNPYPYPLPVGAITSAIRIDEDTYLIAHSNGTIYKYQYISGSLTTYITGYSAIQLKYDALNNAVYIIEPNLVTALDYVSKTVVHSVASAETILSASLLYNR
jgi:hypothetical protein